MRLPNYKVIIKDEDRADSAFLRREGLQRTILRLIGSADGPVLDVGCGDGWLFDSLSPIDGIECDIVEEPPNAQRAFSRQDVRNLSFDDNSFSLVVASLVLMWVDDLPAACKELYRVTRVNGRLVIALVHPYFYRTGEVVEQENFSITRDLSSPFVLTEHYIAEEVGPFVYYYRSLPDYFNACIEAGWSVVHMEDWFIDSRLYRKEVKAGLSRLTRSGKVPMYTFFECRKQIR